MNSNLEAHIELSEESESSIPENVINKWQRADSILDPTEQVTSHRKFIRRWNRLSRLQRSIVYAVLVLIATIIILVYAAKASAATEAEEKSKNSESAQEALKNVSLVMEPVHGPAPKKPKKTVSNIDSEHWPRMRPTQFTGPTNTRQQAVVNTFKFAWKGYKERAWGHDHVKPVSGTASDWFNLGLTIVDGLDTALIMGLEEEYNDGREWIETELIFTRNKDVNFFEVTIRVLGGLLSLHHFTLDDLFMKKAIDLADRLMAAFASPSGIPYSDVNLATRIAHAPDWSHYSTTAEVTTVQLEFRQLSRATKNPMYEDAAASVSEKIHLLPKKHGLVPIFINPNTGHFLAHATITLGARGDSYYEYLLKQWLQTGKTINYLVDDYLTGIEGVREFLARRSSPNKLLFIGELSAGSEIYNPKMDHLTCFLPGTLALGHMNGLPDWHMKMAEELLYTCYLTYAAHPTFLAPEITHFNLASTVEDLYTKHTDAHNLLRPEFVESLWYFYQITGNTTYQDWGWHVYEAMEKYAKVQYGYSSVSNVKSGSGWRDQMESFFLSETLKYFYLLFSDDRYVIDLKKYVVNTEAHPLPIRNNN